ncbi:MAG: hypothetical protein WC260_01815 [Candidatus Pacearchaeota archaeon]
MGNFDHFSRVKNQEFFNYRDNYDNEKLLFDLWSTEAYNQRGVCTQYYVASYNKKYNRIWGEDGNRRFIRFFECMVFYNLPLEDKMWTKFGIEGTDNITMWSTKRHFKEASMYNDNEYIPQIGDVIRSNHDNNYFEITEVGEQVALFLQSKQHVWEFLVKPFKDEHIKLSNETIDSPIKNFTDKNKDIFDISSVVDSKKENIIYKPKPGEKPTNNPFGNW